MSNIGKEFIKVDTLEKCLVVYDKQPSLTNGGQVLVKHQDSGEREWISYDDLSEYYVDNF